MTHISQQTAITWATNPDPGIGTVHVGAVDGRVTFRVHNANDHLRTGRPLWILNCDLGELGRYLGAAASASPRAAAFDTAEDAKAHAAEVVAAAEALSALVMPSGLNRYYGQRVEVQYVDAEHHNCCHRRPVTVAQGRVASFMSLGRPVQLTLLPSADAPVTPARRTRARRTRGKDAARRRGGPWQGYAVTGSDTALKGGRTAGPA